MKERSSSIEILRIGAMLLIVAGHFLGQSGLLDLHPGFAPLLFGSGARWSCNLFLIIGCWFLVEAEFSWRRVARLYFTVLTYSIPLTLLTILAGWHPAVKDVIRGFLPFTGRALWFASAYISLMLLTPWLKRAFSLPFKSLSGLIGLLTILLCGVCTLPDEQMGYAIDCCWFVYVYLAVGWLKILLQSEYGDFVRRRWVRWICLTGGLSIYVALVFARYRFPGAFSTWATQCLMDFKTMPNFLSAVSVFLFFVYWPLGSIKWINRLAKPAFTVYVIHQIPALIPFIWTKICLVEYWQDSPLWWLMALGVVLGVYAIGCLLAFIRRALAQSASNMV